MTKIEWLKKLRQLKAELSKKEMPETIEVNDFSRITNPKNYFDAMFITLEHYAGNPTYEIQLKELEIIIKNL